MNPSSWGQILRKCSEPIRPEKEVIIVFENVRDHVIVSIKKIDDDFLDSENKKGRGIAAIIDLDEVAGFGSH